MTVHGDPGVGKTRLVLEALDTPEISTSVLYVSGPQDLQLLVTRLVRNEESSGTLVADEVSDSDVSEAVKRLTGAAGRWRIVAIRSRANSRWIPSGGRSLVLPHLSPEATERLIVSYAGLQEAQAKMVARVAEGFPELAFRLADELRAQPDLDLVRLSRLDSPQEILKRALGDPEARRHLAPLALFTTVGFDGDMAYQLDAVAAAFGLEPEQVRRYTDAETESGRFVSVAGRLRLISPLLVAIWLAIEAMESTPDVVERVARLPEVLRTAFADQLEYFGPSTPQLPRAVSNVLDDARFRRPPDFTEAAGRFLRAAAAIVPEQVAEAIHELVTNATDQEIRQLPRRDLVWALEVLLWSPDAWESAAASLFRLAVHETETWANNATGEFTDAFAILLSGSTLPYSQRAEWLGTLVPTATATELVILAKAAMAGLRSSHSRTSVGFRGGVEHKDWQPTTNEEFQRARAQAFSLALAVLDRLEGSARATTVDAIAQALRTVVVAGLVEDVDRSLKARKWSSEERAELASGLRRVLRFEEDQPADVLGRVRALHDHLFGDDLNERMDVILRSPLWELEVNPEHDYGSPPLLESLARELQSQPGADLLLLGTGRDLPDQSTRFALARLVARDMGASVVGTTALEAGDLTVLSAALSLADEMNDGAWATFALRSVAETKPEALPDLISAANIDEERLEIALSLIETGRASPLPLARLILGARSQRLSERMLRRVAAALSSAEDFGSAIALIEQWTEAHGVESPEVRAMTGELVLKAAARDTPTMSEFYMERLIARGAVPPDVLPRLLETRLRNHDGLPNSLDDEIVSAALREDARGLADTFTSLISEGPSTSGLYMSTDLRLLSRLAGAVSVDYVWSLLEGLPERNLRWALHHLDWGGAVPEPLVKRFLTSDRLAGLEAEAGVCFRNTLGIVSGPYHVALGREVQRARGWSEDLRASQAADWANRLGDSIESERRTMAEREAEEDAQLGR